MKQEPLLREDEKPLAKACGRCHVHMFAAAGFPIAADGTGVDALVKALVIAGNEAQVEKRVRELLASGLDELMLMLVPVADEAREREQLTQVIGSL